MKTIKVKNIFSRTTNELTILVRKYSEEEKQYRGDTKSHIGINLFLDGKFLINYVTTQFEVNTIRKAYAESVMKADTSTHAFIEDFGYTVIVKPTSLRLRSENGFLLNIEDRNVNGIIWSKFDYLEIFLEVEREIPTSQSAYLGWLLYDSFLATLVQAIDGAEEAECIVTHYLPEQDGNDIM